MGEDQKEEAPVKQSSATTKKIIRIVTVMAYVSGVSGAGFLLSLYYIFFWDPQISGVRPPGYLKSGERLGIAVPEARIAQLPEAFSGGHPIAHPHKMSKEFMEAYMSENNWTKEEIGARSDLMEGQPTPKVMSVVRSESEVNPQQPSPTNPTPPQNENLYQEEQERHQHHQQRHRQQGEPLPTSA